MNRGSGTEPKLKYYIELGGADPQQVQTTLNGINQKIILHLYIIFSTFKFFI